MTLPQRFLSDALGRIKPSSTIAGQPKGAGSEGGRPRRDRAGRRRAGLRHPDFVKEAAIKAIREGKTKYTDPDGIPELKRAVAEKFARENKLDYKPSQISISAGGKSIIYHALLATLNAGDEVLIPTPYWVSYPDMALLCGGTPTFVEGHEAQGFKITPEALERAITPKTKC